MGGCGLLTVVWLSGKVYGTILKGVVGGFEFSFFQRNLKELTREAMDICLQSTGTVY